MNKLLLTGILLIVVAGGAFYLGKNGLNVSFNPKASPTPVATEQSMTTNEVTTTTATSTPTPSNNSDLIAAIKAGLIAEHGQDAASMTITVSEVNGDYAKGMATEQAGGGLWFAAKVNGTWKLVWDGNGVISCSDLTPYPNFPSSLIPQCFNDSTSSMVTR